MAGEAVGFWSYVQQDDAGDHGRILALAEDLKEQYRIQTADQLELFVDRNSIQWGEAWQERIDTAIAGTTFFIPIITPSYFRSPECRRELLKFAREAERLGLKQLLLSVYWVRVPELHDNPKESPDEAIRLVAEYHWQDLRDERFSERGSSVYRRAVAGLAEELARRADSAQTIEDVPDPPVVTADSEDGPALLEALSAAEDAAGRPMELRAEIDEQLRTLHAAIEQSGEEIRAANERGAGIKAVLAITNRFAHEIAQPAKRLGDRGHVYGQVIAEIDRGIQIQLDFIEARSENLTAVAEEYLIELIRLDVATTQSQAALEELVSSAELMSRVSRSVQGPLKDIRSGLTSLIDGNAVIAEWGRRATHIQHMSAKSPSATDEEASSPA